MNKQKIPTANLADFGRRERELLIDLLVAWNAYGLPEGFTDHEVVPMFNKHSGYVFLSNSEYEVAMMNGDKLEQWHTCFNCGHEGFAEDCQLNDEGCNECSAKEE